jgi:hypothetical protein
MAKVDYLTHYRKFQKFNGSLRQFCESRRPKLPFEATKKAFQRIKNGDGAGTKKKGKSVPKSSPDRVGVRLTFLYLIEWECKCASLTPS